MLPGLSADLVVIVYSDQAAFANKINAENWFEILTRENVVVGRSNPYADPNGYRTLLVWQLAEIFYDQPGLYERLAAASPEAYIPTIGTVGNMITVLTVGFMAILVFIFWLSKLGTTVQSPPAEVRQEAGT